MTHAHGQVVKAFGNLLHVRFDGDIRQGEMATVKVGREGLLAEVIEIAGEIAKIQVFEDTRGIKRGTPVSFHHHLLEAELGPGLLGSVFDGLQNPLEEVAKTGGVYLQRGLYMPPLDRKRVWDFAPVVREGQTLERGETLGTVNEGRFSHEIMVPFSLYDKVKISWIAKPGPYNIEAVIAKGVDDKGVEHEFRMLQKWPVKAALLPGAKSAPVAHDGYGPADPRYPIPRPQRRHFLLARALWRRQNGDAAPLVQVLCRLDRRDRRVRRAVR